MTPGARVAAAIAVLDQIRDGAFAEQALTAWARASRFAGAKDRAALRDHVFDVLRCRRSLGDGDGRALMLRLLQRDGIDLSQVFTGLGHAPAPPSAAEAAALAAPLDVSDAAACDLPDWLWPVWQDSLGPAAIKAATAQQARAEVFLRVNRRKTDVAGVIAALADDGIAVEPHDSVDLCLVVRDNPRRIKLSAAYLDGRVELQDAASQRAVQMVPVAPGARVLDYCAGGGGKALAFADRHDAAVFAHDIAAARMADLPDRAARAGVAITRLSPDQLDRHAPYDVVFCDAPCSGSGTWRRSPDAKWRLTRDRLDALHAVQDEVIARSAALVGPQGLLAYATCSVLQDENDAVVARFVQAHPGWVVTLRDQRLPGPDGDGFFLTLLGRKTRI
ncbi:RsmB/NOP family class I SAM-dependent RNA methyltransferase [Yoonia vestfoldensis]|uniref:Ribosomal RNA small subunit methyltransferase B n=1 Tax=Yoonia vestfoldensis TaxID=245188 RepID=A0A1Y0EAG6_9RHOB|nr:RsmB/NOP family class I SAM-dependent RNA methyltransferase [Yoonia vestfoldensis]ARU00615.1 ribosomal RNA small subunit methyltransferase B [Yoonia vestfoldensis]